VGYRKIDHRENVAYHCFVVLSVVFSFGGIERGRYGFSSVTSMEILENKKLFTYARSFRSITKYVIKT